MIVSMCSSLGRFRLVRNESIALLTLLQLLHSSLNLQGYIRAELSRAKVHEFPLAARSFLGSV